MLKKLNFYFIITYIFNFTSRTTTNKDTSITICVLIISNY